LRCSLSHRNDAHLLKDFERVEFVPMLDEKIVFDPPDINRTHGYFSAGGGHADERPGVASPIGVAPDHAVADGEGVLHGDACVGEGLEPVRHERNHAREPGFDVGIVVHVVFRNELGEGPESWLFMMSANRWARSTGLRMTDLRGYKAIHNRIVSTI
jgi:hypothetical protein